MRIMVRVEQLRGSRRAQLAHSLESVLQFIPWVVPAVVQTLQRGAKQRSQLGAVLHQVQQLFAVRMEALQLLWAGEELRQ